SSERLELPSSPQISVTHEKMWICHLLFFPLCYLLFLHFLSSSAEFCYLTLSQLFSYCGFLIAHSQVHGVFDHWLYFCTMQDEDMGRIVSASRKPPEQAAVVPEQAAVVPEQAAVVPEQAAVLPEQAAVVPEQAAVVPEQAAVVPEQAAVVPEQAAVIPEQAAVIPEQAAVIPEQAVVIPEQAVIVPEQAAGVPEQAAGVPEPVPLIPEQVLKKVNYLQCLYCAD
uniref:Uncharacterized protein n=1 Tax=Callorhinchus milii TaxID=7868 RepID=A0A4W3JR97_CALMI